jgi:hypothetical protein
MSTVTNVEFLEEMFSTMPDDASAILAGFVGDPYNPPQYAWGRRPWTFGRQPSLNIHRDANTYTAVSSFHADEKGEYRRRKSQFARLHGVMVDDVGTKVPTGRICLPLSALVETSPRNYQGWWFITPSDRSDSSAISARLIEALVEAGMTSDGTDPGMKGVTRYGRLPVGVNGKAKYVQELGKPFRVRLAEWHPERRYSVEKIAAAHNLSLTLPARPIRDLRPGEASARVETFEQLMQLLASAGLYRESHDGWHDIVCPWVDTHTDRAETGTALREPAPSNNWAGGFRCHHGHCEARTIADIYRWARAYERGAA